MSKLEEMVEIRHPQHPHCATVLLVDVSGSMGMQGKIDQLNAGLEFFKEDALEDDLARKRLELALVTFGAQVEVVRDFTTVDAFEPTTLEAAGTTAMGEAIGRAIDLLEERKEQYKAQGINYYRPWIFLITDGAPTDMQPGDARFQEIQARIHQGETDKRFLFFAVAVEPADLEILKMLAPPNRPPLWLKRGKFKEMFQWLSQSARKVSASRIGEQVAVEDPTHGPDAWASISTE